MRKSLKKVQILLAGTCNLDLDQYNILNEIELSKVLFRVQSSLVLKFSRPILHVRMNRYCTKRSTGTCSHVYM